MIKLKSLLPEAKKLDLSTKEGAAEDLIYKSWKFISNVEDKYDFDDVIMYIDNEEKLSDYAWQVSKIFYPNDEEAWYSFQKDIKNVLHRLEDERLKRRQRATPSLKDPLYVLKKLMVGKTWQAVKFAVSKQLPGRPQNRNVSDDDAAHIFNRLYKNAMGETVYNKAELEKWGFGRMDKAQLRPDDHDHKQHALNIYLRHYGNEGDTVRVWRGTNSPHAHIRPGDFVTLDRGYAQNYFSGKWKSIVTDILPRKDLLLYKLDPGMTEMVYWPEGHEIKTYDGTIPTLRDFWEAHRFGI